MVYYFIFYFFEDSPLKKNNLINFVKQQTVIDIKVISQSPNNNNNILKYNSFDNTLNNSIHCRSAYGN